MMENKKFSNNTIFSFAIKLEKLRNLSESQTGNQKKQTDKSIGNFLSLLKKMYGK
jgi:hypothetical protein